MAWRTIQTGVPEYLFDKTKEITSAAKDRDDTVSKQPESRGSLAAERK